MKEENNKLVFILLGIALLMSGIFLIPFFISKYNEKQALNNDDIIDLDELDSEDIS